jgi:hypothetical protein
VEKEKETGQNKKKKEKKSRENDGDFPIHIPNNNERDCAAYDTRPSVFAITPPPPPPPLSR